MHLPDSNVRHISCACWSFAFPLQKNVYQILLIFHLGCFIFFVSCLYIFNINSLIDNITCKYFLPFSWLLFCFVNGFPCWAKAFKFNQVSFDYFGFISFPLGDRTRNYCCDLCHRVFHLCFLLVVIRFCLISRSLIHFEFIFVCSVRKCSNFILLHVAIQFLQHYLLKRLSFLHCIFLPPL